MSQLANGLLADLQDTRKLLLDRLPVAYSLLRNQDLVFPTKRQFLMDWLLDAFYRLLRADASRICDCITSFLFWELFSALLSPLNWERKRSSINFARPVLPIFITFLTHRSAACEDKNVNDAVRACLNVLIDGYYYVVEGSPIKHIIELLKADGPFDEEHLRILLLWNEAQGTKIKHFGDIHKASLPLLKDRKDNTLLNKLFDEFLLSVSMLSEIDSMTAESLSLILNEFEAAGLAVIFFDYFCRLAKNKSNFRQTTSFMFKYFVDRNSSIAVDLIRIVTRNGFASVQNDQYWATLSDRIKDVIIAEFVSDAVVLDAVARFEYSLLIPNLPEIIQNCPEFSFEWVQFLTSLALIMSQARQLDQFTKSFILESRVMIESELFKEILNPVMKKVHESVFKQLLDDLDPTSVEQPVTVINIFNFWHFLYAHYPSLIRLKLEMVCSLYCRTETPSDILSALLSVVEAFNERSDKDQMIIIKDEFVRQYPGLSCQYFLSGKTLGYLPDPKAVLYYLPALLQSSVPPRMSLTLSSDILQSAIFWESLPSLSFLIDNCRHEDWSLIMEHLPEGLCMSVETATILLQSTDIDPSLMVKILSNKSQDLPPGLDNETLCRLFINGSGHTRFWLFERGLVSVEFVQEKLTCVSGLIIDSVDLLRKATSSLDEPKKAFLFNLALQSVNPNGPWAALAILGPNNAFELISTRLDLTEPQRWKLALEFCSEHRSDLIPFTLHDAWTCYKNYNFMAAREVCRFIRKSDDDVALIVKNDINSFNERELAFLDALMLLSVDIQAIVCPVFDNFLTSGSAEGTLPPLLAKLIHHRLLCGGLCIGLLQEPLLFDRLLQLISRIHHSGPLDDLCAIFQQLFKYHWNLLMLRRPLVVAILQGMLKRVNEAPRKVNRILADFASHRQSDQHFYVSPILLTAVHLNLDQSTWNALTPAMCLLTRILDEQLSVQKANKPGKYFDANPFQRLLNMAETDDARVILKRVFTTYQDEYKFAGKA